MAASDITIRIGTSKPDIVWRMISAGQPFDGTGSEFVLTIYSGGHVLRFSTAETGRGLTFDNATGRLRWHRTVADSRKIGAGRVGRYEIERRIAGEQSTLVEGAVTGKGGLSDD